MLNNKLSIVTGVLVLVLFNDTSVAESDFYVFGKFGKTNSGITFTTENRVDSDNDSYALGVGYTVNQNFSLQAAYQGFGSHNATTGCPPGFACVGLVLPLSTRADLKVVSLSAIGSIPLTDRFDVFGKVGIASWNVDYTGISSAFDTSGEDLLYAAGLRWSIDDNWKISAEYEKVELGFDTAGIGVSYHF